MPKTLQDLKDEADQRLAADNHLGALKLYRLVLESLPLDFELRLQIGDILATIENKEAAVAIRQAVAQHDIKSGNPLRAIVAIKLLASSGIDTKELVGEIASRYAAGSEMLGRAIRPAPADYSAELREDVDLDYPIDQTELVEGTGRMAAYTENIQNYPKFVPPVAIYSTLRTDAFARLLERLKLCRHHTGDAVIRQGDVGDAVYFIARGEVEVVKEVRDQGKESRQLRLARLGPGSLFGEMALVSSDPRGASVICATEADLLELTRRDVDELAGELPQVKGAMARFTRERMIANLLATNPLFEPFDDEAKKQLLGRFTGHEVPKGTIFLEQGNKGNGLYILLQGRAEVLKWDKGEYVKLADLGPGDTAGEISLLHDEPVSATVRTTAPATLLFLARELFQPLVDTVPDLLAHFAKLAQSRLDDTEFKLMQTRALDEDFIEPLDEEELTDDDLVLI